jgi:hypothetical protein
MLGTAIIANETMLEGKADKVFVKVRQYLYDINAAGDLGDDATARKWKTAFSFKTDEGFWRDVEVTVTVVEKPQKLLGGIKWGKKNEKVDDGQTSFGLDDGGDDDADD